MLGCILANVENTYTLAHRCCKMTFLCLLLLPSHKSNMETCLCFDFSSLFLDMAVSLLQRQCHSDLSLTDKGHMYRNDSQWGASWH